MKSIVLYVSATDAKHIAADYRKFLAEHSTELSHVSACNCAIFKQLERDAICTIEKYPDNETSFEDL